MKALMSSMAGLALIASGVAWAGETGESQGSQGQEPFKSSETYTAPQESGADPGVTGGGASQAKAKQRTTGQGSEKSAAVQYVDDAMITTKIKAALAKNPGTSAMAISVETNDQTVQLTGSVQSEDEKKKAESIARSVDGVKEVENKLTVKG
ncbi:MAG: BON domain-containing protein [Gammaproteobacteria bacterium]